MVCLGLEPGQQDGRRRQICWAMVAPHKNQIFIKYIIGPSRLMQKKLFLWLLLLSASYLISVKMGNLETSWFETLSLKSFVLLLLMMMTTCLPTFYNRFVSLRSRLIWWDFGQALEIAFDQSCRHTDWAQSDLFLSIRRNNVISFSVEDKVVNLFHRTV